MQRNIGAASVLFVLLSSTLAWSQDLVLDESLAAAPAGPSAEDRSAPTAGRSPQERLHLLAHPHAASRGRGILGPRHPPERSRAEGNDKNESSTCTTGPTTTRTRSTTVIATDPISTMSADQHDRRRQDQLDGDAAEDRERRNRAGHAVLSGIPATPTSSGGVGARRRRPLRLPGLPGRRADHDDVAPRFLESTGHAVRIAGSTRAPLYPDFGAPIGAVFSDLKVWRTSATVPAPPPGGGVPHSGSAATG